MNIPDIATLREIIASAWREGEEAARAKVEELHRAERLRTSPRMAYLVALEAEMRAFNPKEVAN